MADEEAHQRPNSDSTAALIGPGSDFYSRDADLVLNRER
jgi:hypothetical protein